MRTMRSTHPVARRLMAISIFLTALIAGCGSYNPATSSNPVSITLTPSAAQTVDQGKTVAVTATLAYDTNNQGVTWSLSPAIGSGTLSGSTSTATTYTAPSSVTAASTVTLTATS